MEVVECSREECSVGHMCPGGFNSVSCACTVVYRQTRKITLALELSSGPKLSQKQGGWIHQNVIALEMKLSSDPKLAQKQDGWIRHECDGFRKEIFP